MPEQQRIIQRTIQKKDHKKALGPKIKPLAITQCINKT